MRLFSTVVLVSAITASTIFANPLRDEAIGSGLEAIPQSYAQLLEFINDKNDPITDAKVELGKKLYFDPRLSKSGIISCNTCHNLALGGVDGVDAAIGHKWTKNPSHLNSPTVYNSVFNQVQFWDGRSPHLADQAQGPIQAGPEMAAPKDLVEARINSIPQYVAE
ncbi:MAG: cytochrome-c peroxidase, partial [Campylobacteraceae bacterium]